MKTTSCLPLSTGLAAAAFVFTVSTSLHAVDRLWSRAGGGTFSTASNWTSDLIPGTLDTAVFTLTSSRGAQPPYSVGFTADATNRAVEIQDDRVTFDLNSRTYRTTAATGNVIGTVPGFAGSLTITEGTWDLAENSALLIGGAAGATGALTVTFFGNLTDGALVIGQAGPGSFTVTNGAVANVDSVLVANAPGVTGAAALSGASFWTTTGAVVVGASGNGGFTMNGGQMNCASAMLGSASGSTGIATMVDGQWQLGTGSMIVGNNGTGQLNITSSGEVINGRASIGELASGAGTVTVDGAGSKWISTGKFEVGKAGEGALEVTNGGLVRVVLVDDGSISDGTVQVGVQGTGSMLVESGGLVESRHLSIGSDGEAIVSGSTSQCDLEASVDVGGAGGGTGVLRIRQGGVVAGLQGFVGGAIGSVGAAFVEDAGSRWTNSGELDVANSGTGSLTISGGGVVENSVGRIGGASGGSGDVLVTGPGSLWDNSSDLFVSFGSSDGALEIAAGGRVNNANGVVGGGTGMDAEVIVRDPGSVWNNAGLLTVGNRTADARLTVSAGGDVRSAGGVIAENDTSIGAVVTVSDPLSRWINSGDLLVGDAGSGELRVLNGALVQNLSAKIGGGTLSGSKATVDGAGSIWINNGVLEVAAPAGCELIISDGGTVQSNTATIQFGARLRMQGGDFSVGPLFNLFNHGTIDFETSSSRLSGGLLNNTNTGRIVVSGNSTANFHGGLLNSGTVQVSPGSTAVYFGSVGGAGSFPGGGAHFFQGGLAPGTSPALITFGGDVSFGFSNTLTMELSGIIRGSQYDSLSITGSMAAGGRLDVQLIAGFVPQQGQSFDLFDAGTIGGVFSSLSLPALTAGLTWDISRLYSDGIIRVVPGGLTFFIWAAVSGLPGALPNNDHDSDGTPNAVEFALGLFPPQPGTVLPEGSLHLYNDSERLRILFTRPLDRTGVTLKVQGSNDPTLWEDLAVSVDSAPFTGPGFVSENRAHPVSEPGLVEVRDILNTATTPRRQIRVRIEIAP